MLQPSDATTKPEQLPWGELLDLAEAMRDLADRATDAEGLPALDDLVNLAVERVPSARWASLTVLRAKKFRTEATTDEGATVPGVAVRAVPLLMSDVEATARMARAALDLAGV